MTEENEETKVAGDAKQTELFHFLNNTIKTALLQKYGAPKPEDNLPARVAVVTLQISMRYFIATQAPKSVVLRFVKDVLYGPGKEPPADDANPQSPIHHPAMGEIARFGK